MTYTTGYLRSGSSSYPGGRYTSTGRSCGSPSGLPRSSSLLMTRSSMRPARSADQGSTVLLSTGDGSLAYAGHQALVRHRRRPSRARPWSLTVPLERAEGIELGGARPGDDLRIRGHGQVPSGPLLRGRRGDARVQPGQGELERHWIRFQDAEVGDDLLGPGPGEPQPLAVARAGPVAHRGDEIHP